MNIRNYLKENILVTDGAMGTYFGELMGNVFSCEMASINNPEIIRKIHREYIKAGAKLIRTNTFSANSLSMNISKENLKELLKSSYNIAINVAKTDAFVGCSIGPLHESQKRRKNEFDYFPEYKFIIDTLLDEGADIFLFETFGSTDYLEKISDYIKSKSEDAFILVQFSVMADGYTRRGNNIKKIIKEVKNMKSIDAFGLNCGSGPAHIYNILKSLELSKEDIVSVLPNAGYPEIINGRMVYVNNPDYFSEKILDMAKYGAKIVGGCCGTTPEHIREIVKKLNGDKYINFELQPPKMIYKKRMHSEKNSFKEKLDNNQFVVAVELDPPFNIELDKMLKNAQICKQNGIDLLTIADSPRGMARVDSLMVASKIKNDIDIEVMPHICCRDKNMNALKSGIMGAHINGIRNILAITGDPVLDIDNVYTKSVFNMNSYELINMINNMNEDLFIDDEILISGALNLNVKNRNSQMGRLRKKSEKGAEVYLTQPIYSDDTIEYLKNMDRNGEKILAGILPVISYKNAEFLNNELPGITIPEKYINLFKNIKDKNLAIETGIDISVNIIEDLRNYVDGIYFITPFNRIEIITEIMRRTDLLNI